VKDKKWEVESAKWKRNIEKLRAQSGKANNGEWKVKREKEKVES